jgi:phage terminase Nu1 subunit (DNA packaging protein)
MTGSAQDVARHCRVDAATVRRWPEKGCPVVRRGRPGPGRGYLFDLEQVAKWRDQANGPVGLTPDEILQRVAGALWDALEKDHADIRAGITREDAAAAFLVAWERCCKNFAVSFKFDAHPEPIRALAREL